MRGTGGWFGKKILKLDLNRKNKTFFLITLQKKKYCHCFFGILKAHKGSAGSLSGEISASVFSHPLVDIKGSRALCANITLNDDNPCPELRYL